MTLRIVVCVAVVLGLGVSGAWAVPAAPITVTLTQDDGSTFPAVPKGDEYHEWMETLDGYTVVKSGLAWFYAQQAADGTLEASTYKAGAVGTKALPDVPKHLSPPVNTARLHVAAPRSLGLSAVKGAKSLVHTQNVVTILVDFNDITFTGVDASYTDAAFQSLLYGAGGSVKQYYLENTYNNFTVISAAETQGTANDGIIHIALGTNHPNLGTGDSRTLAQSIMTAADPYINYASFDTSGNGTVSAAELSIIMILAGYEKSYGGASALTPNVWGHQWTLASPLTLDGVALQPYGMFGEAHATSVADRHIATIGIMCHELGHLMLDLPDLYDIDGSSEGIGEWGLMGSGSWLNTGTWAGDSPCHFCAWSKAILDITTPTVISAAASGVTFAQASSNADIKRFWIDKYRVRESFLIENRQLTGFDAGLPGSGLLVFHIDDLKTDNATDSHRLVDVEEADGLNHLDSKANRGDAGDPFPGSSSNATFNDASTPNSKDYANAATGIAVTGISASAGSMTADVTVSATGGTGNHVRYDDGGYTGNALTYGTTTVWTALRITNTTSMDQLEGFEVYTNGAGTVDFYLYSSIPGGVPTSLLHSETGFSCATGWNRFLLATPQSFPAASDRVMVLKITQAVTANAFIDDVGVVDNRSYIDNNGSGSYTRLDTGSGFPSDLNQIALLGTAADTTPPTVVLTSAAPDPTNTSPIAVTATFSEDVSGFTAGDVVAGNATVGNFAGGPQVFTFELTPSGEGTVTADVPGAVCTDGAGNPNTAAAQLSRTYDSVPPGVSIGAPSVSVTAGGPVAYTVTYTGADTVTLTDVDVTLNATGTAAGTAAVSGSGTATRTVTISSITGDGTLGITLASNTASDTAGNNAPAAGPSATFTVDNTAPVITLIGANPLDWEEGTIYVDPGATATDTYDGDLTGSLVTDTSAVDINTVATYTVAYRVTDSAGNMSQANRTVNVTPAPPSIPLAAWPLGIALGIAGALAVRRRKPSAA